MADISEIPNFSPIIPIQLFNGIEIPFRNCENHSSSIILTFGSHYEGDLGGGGRNRPVIPL